MNNGWIKIHRSILEWEWWDDRNTRDLFIYLLIEANHDTKKWHGIDIPRGSLVTSRKQLSISVGISEQSIRTSLDKLEGTHNLTIKSTNKYSIITICNYDKYQDTQDSNQPAEQPTTNQQLTNKQEKEKKNPPITPYKENKKNLDINVEEQEWKNFISRKITRAREEEGGKEEKKYFNEIVSVVETPTPLLNDSTAYVSTKKIYAEYRDELTADTDTSNSAIMMASGYGREVTRDWLGKMLDLFHNTKLAANEQYDTTGNYRRHFINWLRIKLTTDGKDSKQTNKQHNNGQPNIRLHPTKPTGKFSADF